MTNVMNGSACLWETRLPVMPCLGRESNRLSGVNPGVPCQEHAFVSSTPRARVFLVPPSASFQLFTGIHWEERGRGLLARVRPVPPKVLDMELGGAPYEYKTGIRQSQSRASQDNRCPWRDYCLLYYGL